MLNDPWIAAAAGVAVSAVSAAMAWAGVRLAGRRATTMMLAILGGTLVRLVFVAGASILLLSALQVHAVGYAAGLIVTYLLFLGIEIALVARAGRGDASS